MILAESILSFDEKIKSFRDKNFTINLVPTMGSLHEGHISIIKKSSLSDKTLTVVSIFVNPTQFGDSNDFKEYPRNLIQDIDLINKNIKNKNILIFVPKVEEIYRKGFNLEKVDLNGLDENMEGKFRRKHFQGVVTIVLKLFQIIQPKNAFFGEKDYQQLAIISNVVSKKNIEIKIIPCDTIREKNGLAMSSRNKLLSDKERAKAKIIFQSLCKVKEKKFEDLKIVKKQIIDELKLDTNLSVEYLEIADEKNLKIVNKLKRNTKYRVFMAVRIGVVRLIDNMPI